MRLWYCIISLLLLFTLAGCGGSNTTTNNVGLFGNWNVAMYPTASQNPVYVFALATSQEGTNYSGASITYTGSVSPPANMCIDANTLTATATTTSNGSYTMTISDASSNTIITVNGTLPTTTTTVNGNYSNAASATCPASQGTMSMVPQ